MMPDLQHVGLHICAGVHQVGLRVLLHVAGEEEARPAVVDAQDQTAVIGVGIRLHRPDDLDARAAERPAVAGLRHLDGVPLLVGVFDDVGEDLRRVFRDARIDVLRRVFGQHGGKAPAVVLVRMRVDHIGQLRHVQPVQTGDEKLPLLDRAAVDEHGLVPAGEQDAVALADVEKADGERLIRRCLLRCGGRSAGGADNPGSPLLRSSPPKDGTSAMATTIRTYSHSGMRPADFSFSFRPSV